MIMTQFTNDTTIPAQNKLSWYNYFYEDNLDLKFKYNINKYNNIKHTINDYEDKCIISVDLPGYKKDEIKFSYSVDDNILTIIAENNIKNKTEFEIYAPASCKNNLRLITTSLELGVLKVNLLKVFKPRDIKFEWI